MPCVSSQSQPHDVVGSNTCLKMWDKGSKGEDGMTVNQELDLDGRAENRGNLSRTIRKIKFHPILFLSQPIPGSACGHVIDYFRVPSVRWV